MLRLVKLCLYFENNLILQVYWIVRSGSQCRIIATDITHPSWCISIPLDYPIDVILLNQKRKGEVCLPTLV